MRGLGLCMGRVHRGRPLCNVHASMLGPATYMLMRAMPTLSPSHTLSRSPSRSPLSVPAITLTRRDGNACLPVPVITVVTTEAHRLNLPMYVPKYVPPLGQIARAKRNTLPSPLQLRADRLTGWRGGGGCAVLCWHEHGGIGWMDGWMSGGRTTHQKEAQPHLT